MIYGLQFLKFDLGLITLAYCERFLINVVSAKD